MQYAVCRQKPNSITAMNAARMLRDLAKAGSLEQEAAHTLISVIQREKSFGKSLNSVLQQASPALTKMVRSLYVPMLRNFAYCTILCRCLGWNAHCTQQVDVNRGCGK